MNLFDACAAALVADDIDAKLAIVDALRVALAERSLDLRRGPSPAAAPDLPGRPACPALVAPRALAGRGMASASGRLAMLHAIAHIEFNAIHLALDACLRFADLPDDYYRDWAHVAVEEALHFTLLRALLRERGSAYGAYPAHDGLWEMARTTAHDPLVRMALVPRVLEARGLDVTPGIRERFAAAGDRDAVSILDVILRDEIGHVAIGNRWYRYLCAARGLEPQATFERLAREHRAPRPQGPLNRAARLAGGFTEAELDALARPAPR